MSITIIFFHIQTSLADNISILEFLIDNQRSLPIFCFSSWHSKETKFDLKKCSDN